MMLVATRGFLGPLFITVGFGIGAAPGGITTYADPRQGTILYPDSSRTGVDPRMGTVFSTDVDPRQGTILDPDESPIGVNPRRGTVIN